MPGQFPSAAGKTAHCPAEFISCFCLNFAFLSKARPPAWLCRLAKTPNLRWASPSSSSGDKGPVSVGPRTLPAALRRVPASQQGWFCFLSPARHRVWGLSQTHWETLRTKKGKINIKGEEKTHI